MQHLAQALWGTVTAPQGVSRYANVSVFVTNLIRTLIVGAGIYALFNLVLAGYAFMSAAGEPQKIAGAWAKIWQTLLGLALSVGSFVLAAIFGRILFNDANALLQITVYGP